MPAQLHHERIGHEGARHWLLMLHGILGSGANWRSVARALTERRPEWGVVLADLRQHGHSEAGEPPHDLLACADDIHALVDELGGVDAIGGHSFGGKAALAARASGRPDLRQTWIFDASPGTSRDRANSPLELAAQLLELMERLPQRWERREDFIQQVVAAGHPRPLAQWLAMNLAADGSGYALGIDIAAIRDMLADYYHRDLWPVLLDPALPGSVEFVIAQQSPIVTADDQRRLDSAPPHLHVHTIDAGHWLHIEAPDAVLDLLAHGLAPRE